MTRRPDRRDGPWLLALVVTFLASRIAWLISSPTTASYWEESYRWLAIHELLQGGPQSLLDLQADHYQGGSLVMILLGVPAFALLGESVLTLKLAPLLFGTATLVLLHRLGLRCHGAAAARIAGAAYVASPPLVAFMGLLEMGTHGESSLFSLAQIAVFLGLLSGEARHPRGFGLFGLLGGLGVWFCYTAGLSVAACAITWLVLEGRPRRNETLAVIGGFAIGMLPWLAYNATHDFAGIVRLLEVFGLEPLADPWAPQTLPGKLAELVTRVLPFAWIDPAGELPAPLRMLLAAGFGLPAVAAAFGAGKRALAVLAARYGAAGAVDRRARLELVFVVYVVVFFAVYLASRYAVESGDVWSHRLFAPLGVVGLMPLAISFARVLETAPAQRGLATAGLAAWLGSAALATAAFATGPANPGGALSFELGYKVLGVLLHRKHEPELAPSLAVAQRYEERAARDAVLFGIGWGMTRRFEVRESLDVLEARLRAIPAAERAHVLAGIRWGSDTSLRALSVPRPVRNAEALAERRARHRALAGFAAEAEPNAGRPSVVLVTLDTTRVDHLSTYGYERETSPSLDRLARAGVRYDRVWSTSGWTLPAHASLFTGLYPATHGARYDASGAGVLGSVIGMPIAHHVRAGRLADARVTLAERLAERGYRTGAFVAGPWLHRSFGLMQGFETIDDDVTGFAGRPAREITDQAIAWLESLAPNEPYLLFANYFDAHAPYRPPPGYDDLPRAREEFEPPHDALVTGARSLSSDERSILVDRYDGEIRYMDHHLGRLIDAVDARSDPRQVLVVVTADHGEAFGEGGRFGHTYWLSEELLRLPLVVRYPYGARAGTRDSSLLQLVDVLPLIGAEVGLALPDDIDGRPPGTRRVAFAELYREATAAARFGERFDRDLGAVIDWPYKLVRSSRGTRALHRIDAALAREVDASDPAVERRLAEGLDAHEQAIGRQVPIPADVDPAMLESLRRLGYVE